MIVEYEGTRADEAEYFDDGCVHGVEVDDCVLCNPTTPTCHELADLVGEQWPRDAAEAAGEIPEELWEVSLNESTLQENGY